MRSADGGRPGRTTGRAPSATSTARVASAVRGRGYEAGGGGAAFSVDGGETWRPADDGRDRNYTWALAVDPADPDLLVRLGEHRAVRGARPRRAEAHVYRRQDAEPWVALAGGLPEPLPAMPYALLAADDRLFAGLSDGQLWESRDHGETWRGCEVVGEELGALVALALG